MGSCAVLCTALGGTAQLFFGLIGAGTLGNPAAVLHRLHYLIDKLPGGSLSVELSCQMRGASRAAYPQFQFIACSKIIFRAEQSTQELGERE